MFIPCPVSCLENWSMAFWSASVFGKIELKYLGLRFKSRELMERIKMTKFWVILMIEELPGIFIMMFLRFIEIGEIVGNVKI